MSDARTSRAGKARVGALGFTAIAIVLSILSAFLLYKILAKKGYDQEQMQPIVVATKPLKAGMPIDPERVSLKNWPAQSIPNGAFASVEGLMNQQDTVPLHTILAGEAVVQSRLSSAKTGSGMAPLIPKNLRGFAVRADRWLTDAEMLYPGAIIDVVASSKIKVRLEDGRGSQDISVSKIVLQKVRVVAVNGAVDGVRFSQGTDGKEKQKASRGSRAVVSLLVTPEQAERLALAKAGGELDFILRNSADDGESTTSGATVSTLYDMQNMQAVLQESIESDSAAKKNKVGKRPRASVRRRAKRVRRKPARKSRNDGLTIE